MGRVQTEETKRKQSEATKRLHREGKLKSFGFSPAAWENRRQNIDKHMKTASFDTLSYEFKRRRLIHEQENRCAKCSLSEWMGQSLILELDHKDGIGDNDVRENLEMLCPNCHSLTPTWRGRNKPSRNSFHGRVTDEELGAALQSAPSIRQALLAVGMAAKGNNYTRAKRLLAERGDIYIR